MMKIEKSIKNKTSKELNAFITAYEIMRFLSLCQAPAKFLIKKGFDTTFIFASNPFGAEGGT